MDAKSDAVGFEYLGADSAGEGGKTDDTGMAVLSKKLKNGDVTTEDLVFFASGAVIATTMPTPADVLHFYYLKWINDHRYDLSPTAYWMHNVLDYYAVDGGYQILLLLWVLLSKRPVAEKTKMYFAILAGGAVVGILGKFVVDEQKHREELSQKVKQGGAQSLEQAEFVQSQQSETSQKQAPRFRVGDLDILL
jgi:hypothetical protein